MIKIAKFGGSSVADAEHFKKIKAIVDADPAEDRHAVPLVMSRGGDLIPQGLQPEKWQLVQPGLGLLDGQYVDLLALQERLDPVDPAAQGVDVPGGDPHRGTISGSAVDGIGPPRLAGTGRFGPIVGASWTLPLRAGSLPGRYTPIPQWGRCWPC